MVRAPFALAPWTTIVTARRTRASALLAARESRSVSVSSPDPGVVFDARATVDGSKRPGSFALTRALTVPAPPTVTRRVTRPVRAQPASCLRVSAFQVERRLRSRGRRLTGPA